MEGGGGRRGFFETSRGIVSLLTKFATVPGHLEIEINGKLIFSKESYHNILFNFKKNV